MLKKQIALEKWESTMQILAGGQTKDAIRWRQIIGQSITHTRSRTEFEREALPDLLRHFDILLALESRLKKDSPKTDGELEACIQMAVEDVDHPGKNATLLEAMLHKSVESVKSMKQESACFENWCRRRDSNSHSFRHYPLKIACLPISPRRHKGVF